MIAVDTPGGVRALFSTRSGGVSSGGYASLNLGLNTDDNPAAVRENWGILAARSGLTVDAFVANRQVHGRAVHVVDAAGRDGADADALVTRRSGVGLLALGADCLPVLLWRVDGRAIGAVHAGWRGVLAGVIAEAAGSLGGGLLCAAVGPGIGPCCYPVGDDVREAFLGAFGASVVMGRAIDVRHAALIALKRAGVGAERIQSVNRCTSCEPDHFFSYRRDGAVTGRQAGLIWRS